MLESRLPLVTSVHALHNSRLHAEGAGDSRGYYATKQAFKRDVEGTSSAKDPMGASSMIVYDADGVFPIQPSMRLAKSQPATFNTSGDPHKVSLPDGRRMRFETDPLAAGLRNSKPTIPE
jgi:hypothetical protein